MTLTEVRELVKRGKARCEIQWGVSPVRVCSLKSNGREIYRRKVTKAQMRTAKAKTCRGGCSR